MPLVVDEQQMYLTPKEALVLLGVKDGLTQGEIALKMHRAKSTIRSHVKHIEQKLNVKNSAQAVAKAVELGVLRLLSCVLVAIISINGVSADHARRALRSVRVVRVAMRRPVERLGSVIG